MNRVLIRFVSLFLIPALLIDPITASAFSTTHLLAFSSSPSIDLSRRLTEEALEPYVEEVDIPLVSPHQKAKLARTASQLRALPPHWHTIRFSATALFAGSGIWAFHWSLGGWAHPLAWTLLSTLFVHFMYLWIGAKNEITHEMGHYTSYLKIKQIPTKGTRILKNIVRSSSRIIPKARPQELLDLNAIVDYYSQHRFSKFLNLNREIHLLGINVPLRWRPLAHWLKGSIVDDASFRISLLEPWDGQEDIQAKLFVYTKDQQTYFARLLPPLESGTSPRLEWLSSRSLFTDADAMRLPQTLRELQDELQQRIEQSLEPAHAYILNGNVDQQIVGPYVLHETHGRITFDLSVSDNKAIGKAGNEAGRGAKENDYFVIALSVLVCAIGAAYCVAQFPSYLPIELFVGALITSGPVFSAFTNRLLTFSDTTLIDKGIVPPDGRIRAGEEESHPQEAGEGREQRALEKHPNHPTVHENQWDMMAHSILPKAFESRFSKTTYWIGWVGLACVIYVLTEHITTEVGVVGLLGILLTGFIAFVTGERRMEYHIALQQKLEEELRRREADRQELERALTEANTKGMTDSLTGLFNRKYLDSEEMANLINHAAQGDPLTLVMLDIDNFGKFNNDFGHEVGDQVLKETTASIMRHIRGSDRVFRYGGEEIVIILPHTTLEKGFEIAERIRASLHDISDTPRRITGSFGLALFDPSLVDDRAGSASAELGNAIKRADQAMYVAKKGLLKEPAKDQVVMWKPGLPLVSEMNEEPRPARARDSFGAMVVAGLAGLALHFLGYAGFAHTLLYTSGFFALQAMILGWGERTWSNGSEVVGVNPRNGKLIWNVKGMGRRVPYFLVRFTHELWHQTLAGIRAIHSHLALQQNLEEGLVYVLQAGIIGYAVHLSLIPLLSISAGLLTLFGLEQIISAPRTAVQQATGATPTLSRRKFLGLLGTATVLGAGGWELLNRSHQEPIKENPYVPPTEQQMQEMAEHMALWFYHLNGGETRRRATQLQGTRQRIYEICRAILYDQIPVTLKPNEGMEGDRIVSQHYFGNPSYLAKIRSMVVMDLQDATGTLKDAETFFYKVLQVADQDSLSAAVADRVVIGTRQDYHRHIARHDHGQAHAITVTYTDVATRKHVPYTFYPNDIRTALKRIDRDALQRIAHKYQVPETVLTGILTQETPPSNLGVAMANQVPALGAFQIQPGTEETLWQQMVQHHLVTGPYKAFDFSQNAEVAAYYLQQLFTGIRKDIQIRLDLQELSLTPPQSDALDIWCWRWADASYNVGPNGLKRVKDRFIDSIVSTVQQGQLKANSPAVVNTFSAVAGKQYANRAIYVTLILQGIQYIIDRKKGVLTEANSFMAAFFADLLHDHPTVESLNTFIPYKTHSHRKMAAAA